MNLFSRKHKESMTITPSAESRVEVELHKDATIEAAEAAKAANEHLNSLLLANGFTLKIYLAAGGMPPKRKKSGK